MYNIYIYIKCMYIYMKTFFLPSLGSIPKAWLFSSPRGLGTVYDATAVEEFFGAKPFAVLGRFGGAVLEGGLCLAYIYPL